LASRLAARFNFRWRSAVLPALTAVWLLAMVPGVRYLFAYEATAGRQGTAPGGWPAKMASLGDAKLPTMVIALHPKCSCSQATLSELELAAKDFDHPYNAVMLIYTPHGASYEWQNVRFYREAQEALHAKVILDEDGKMARIFGMLTSGDVLYYSAEKEGSPRRLLFAGGVTGSRGMTGSNVGIESLKTAFKTGDEPEQARTPVFGCGLLAALTSGPERNAR
jgi:hypothetical protein